MGSTPGLGACALTHLTAGAQPLKTPQAKSPKWQEGKSESCESAAAVKASWKHLWCNKSGIIQYALHVHRICAEAFYPPLKHYSTICLQLNFPLFCFCFCCERKKQQPKTLYRGLYPKLLRFLFRGYEREPWQTTFFSMKSVGKAFQADCRLPGSID